MADPAAVVTLSDVHKTFRLGFAWGQRVEAVRGLSLAVHEGETLGFLGPNGAGKTTTLKMLMGLIRPTAGTIRVMGHPPESVEARRAIGFLPENPYFYGYLNAREFLDLCGRLQGVDRATRTRRAGDLLDRVGLGDRGALPLRRYSKGMLQRVGLAQALMGDPRLVVLDEPQSGLDPIGRKQMRDLIRALARDEGKTVFFSSHVLADVEVVCDRVALVVEGRLRAIGAVDDLLEPHVLSVDVALTGDPAALTLPEGLGDRAREVRREARAIWFSCVDGDAADAVVRAAAAARLHVERVAPNRETLEDVFVREARSGTAPAPEAGS